MVFTSVLNIIKFKTQLAVEHKMKKQGGLGNTSHSPSLTFNSFIIERVCGGPPP